MPPISPKRHLNRTTLQVYIYIYIYMYMYIYIYILLSITHQRVHSALYGSVPFISIHIVIQITPSFIPPRSHIFNILLVTQ
jgi:hypothetical protein